MILFDPQHYASLDKYAKITYKHKVRASGNRGYWTQTPVIDPNWDPIADFDAFLAKYQIEEAA